MSGTNKYLMAFLLLMVVLLGTMVYLVFNTFSIQPQQAVNNNVNQGINNNVNQGGSVNTPAGNNGGNQGQSPVANSPVNSGDNNQAEVQLSDQEILDMLANAVNKTKARTDSFSVHHTESVDINVTECTGGSVVASFANSIAGSLIKPSDEVLNFSNGTSVNSEGETVTILLPQKGNFNLSLSDVSAISASSDGTNTTVYVTLVSETVGVNDAPKANSSSIGYLDLASIDVDITSANVVYPGSTIAAIINPDGYVIYAEYTISMNVAANAKIAFVNGKASFEGKEVEIWDFR